MSERHKGFSSAGFADGDARPLYAVLLGAALLALVLMLAGCGSLQGSYVSADEKTFNAIAPVYSAYVVADEKLDPQAKERRLRLLRSWGARIEEGKKHD